MKSLNHTAKSPLNRKPVAYTKNPFVKSKKAVWPLVYNRGLQQIISSAMESTNVFSEEERNVYAEQRDKEDKRKNMLTDHLKIVRRLVASSGMGPPEWGRNLYSAELSLEKTILSELYLTYDHAMVRHLYGQSVHTMPGLGSLKW